VIPEEVTQDSICAGNVQVRQSRDGYRFNLDPVLLAHFAYEAGLRGPTIDLGTGTGIIALILARKFGLKHLTGVELQPSLFALAHQNVALNQCERRIALVHGDLREIHHLLQRHAFAHVICNPPYGARGAGRPSPGSERAIARHEMTCSLKDVVRAASHLLRVGGSLSLVYPAPRLAHLMSVLCDQKFRPRLLRMVHPRSGRAAKLVLVRAIKAGRSPVTVLPPLVLHADRSGAFTDEVSAMVGGSDATLDRDESSPPH
jgi:tRNA1Val (adenine37-N6)-methyltransferase